MQKDDATVFDVSHFINSYGDLEKSFLNLLTEKNEIDLKLKKITTCYHEIKEKYEQERKNNLQMASMISEETDKLINEQNYYDKYEHAKKEIEKWKRTVDFMNKQNVTEKEDLLKQMKLVKMTMQEEVQKSENKVKNLENQLQKLQTELEEQKVELLEHRKYIKQMNKLYNDLEQQYGSLPELEGGRMLSHIIKKHQNAQKKVKECLRAVKAENGSKSDSNISCEGVSVKIQGGEQLERQNDRIKLRTNILLNEMDELKKTERVNRKRNRQIYYKI